MLRLAFLTLVFVAANVWADNPLTYKDFSQLPDASDLTLSPGGKKLAALVRVALPDQKGVAVQVTELKSGEKEFMLFTDNSRYFINWMRWKDDRTLLVSTYYPARRDTWIGFAQIRGDTRETRLLIIDTDSGEVTTPFRSNFLRRFQILPPGLDEVVDILPDDPDHILMALPAENALGPNNVIHRVNIRNQRTRVVQRPENRVVSWHLDQQHNVRLATHIHDQTVTLRAKEAKSGRWRDLWNYDIFSADEVYPIGFGYDPNTLYINAYHNGLKALFKVDLGDEDLTKELVYSHPHFDISAGLVYDRKGKRVIGIGGSHDGGTVFFDDELNALKASIDSALPNSRNSVYSLTDDLNKFLVYSTGRTESGTYYLGTREPRSLNAVAYRYGALEPQRMTPVRNYHYKARDGLDIHAWLTRPAGSEGKLPTLMFPHGGPHARDSDAFDYWSQYFASLGYAVLQMNFRGSTGQGHAFFEAGLQNWGKEMQDDIEDGARALIADGIADPDRICIVGASYGGYAALMGAVKTPDFYQCAISFAGVSDVFELVRSRRDFSQSYNVIEAQVGRHGRQLREISPVNHAETVKIPVLLVHGDSDRQVEAEHSQKMYAALKRAGKDVTYIELPNEDHYLSNEDNRVATFRAMGEFLEKHLPVLTTQ
ncbi:S9 family peptidase [Marinimicrobium sp. ABcell2]|uniref:alpha/beta hydrolase family protein n=1 Tax=Marinimicrobium sp. ABcell2 TaxID=3069751 RepID=UPI0027AF4A99|nr:S9 family peptidase [Marinimicrobium sp. ABcell2]MDQ2076098.1 S9 family peptidase [Marinimicrobium sp. ABcell2]